MNAVRVIWWILGIYFFAEAIHDQGIVKGVLQWINPLAPPIQP
jgi:hypothetical protein